MSSRCVSQHRSSVPCILLHGSRVSCDAELPAPPETLSGRSLSASSVELTWSMPAEARAAPTALEYALRYRPKGEPNSSEVRLTRTTTLPPSSHIDY